MKCFGRSTEEQWNWMDNNYNGAQHKEASVDVSSWKWHGSGPYAINFIARQNGAIIAQQQEAIYVDNGAQSVATTVTLQPVASQPTPYHLTTTTTAAAASTTATVAAKVTVSAPVVTVNTTGLYTKPNSSAAQQATPGQAVTQRVPQLCKY
jgi:hypothetical protein